MDAMSSELVSGSVDKVSFDYGIEVLVGGAVLRIEGDAMLGYGPDAVGFDAEDAAAVAEDLVKLLHADLRVSVSPESALQFHDEEDRQVLSASPSSDYESWTAALADGSKAVCGLDGNVTGWSPS